jgi:hypothetical protein
VLPTPDFSLLAQFDLGPIIINFGNIISGLVQAIQSTFNFLFNFTINVANFLWGTIGNVHGFNLNIFGSVGSFFRNLWEHWIKRGLIQILQLYATLKEKLTKWMEPVLRVLRRMRQLQDLWFNKYLRPVLDLMQRVRRILAVFRALHIKWAEALDRRLAQTESRIFEAFNAIRRKTNELISLVNIITDPTGLIRGTVLGRSILGALGAIGEALNIFAPSSLSTSTASENRALHEIGTPSVVIGWYNEAVEHDTGPLIAWGDLTESSYKRLAGS